MGFYFAVVEPGDVRAENEIEIIERDKNGVSVTDIYRLFVGQTDDPELRERAMKIDALPPMWKMQLLQRHGTPAPPV